MSRADVNDPIESLGLSEKHAELIKREIVEKSGSLDHVKFLTCLKFFLAAAFIN